MKKRKSILALSLVAVISIGLLCGCWNIKTIFTDASTTSTSASTSTEPVKLAERTIKNYSSGTLYSLQKVTYNYGTGLETWSSKDASSDDWATDEERSFTFDDDSKTFQDTYQDTLNGEDTEIMTTTTYWDNWLTKAGSYHVNNKLVISQSYNEYGLITAFIMTDLPYSTYFYDYNYLEYQTINGQSYPTYAYIIETFETGDVISTSYVELSYDNNGNVIQQLFKDDSDQTTSCTQYEYNSSGNLTRITEFKTNDDGSLSLSCITEYTYE
jgi:YD repeat-containing protein